MRWYIAGPMTGIPQFNFPAFHKAAAHLRACGHEVISPAETDPGDTQKAALASTDGDLSKLPETWGDMLSRDVKIVADKVDGIAFLHCWERSRGARLEAFTGLLCGKKFGYVDVSDTATGIYPLDALTVRSILKRHMP
jgi:hypothetical protein